MQKNKIVYCSSSNDMNMQVAEYIVSVVQSNTLKHHQSTLALSGGNTPQGIYTLLASARFAKRIPWENMHLFQVDERYVPYNHEYNNFRMIDELLVSHIPLDPTHVHRIDTTAASVDDAAKKYESELKTYFSTTNFNLPKFDLILLGMGMDGHIASLFPNDPAMEETSAWVCAVNPPLQKPRVPRITLTVPILTNAESIVIVASGTEKVKIIQEIVTNPQNAKKRYPAAWVIAQASTLCFITM